MFRRRAVLTAAAALIAGLAVLAVPSNGAASGGFTVVGNKIMDPSGKVFTMRGLNVLFDAQLDGPQNRPSSDIDQIAGTWHANTIRLLVSEDFWIGSQPTINGVTNPNYCAAYAGYTSTIDDWVTKATARGLLVLIDLHTNELNGVIPCSPTYVPQRHKMADRALGLTYWQQIATRYGNNNHVAFEPYNEPQCLTPDQWLHGGQMEDDSCDSGGTSFEAAGMQDIYDTIRGTGAQNLIVVDGVKDPGSSAAGGYDVSYALTTPVAGTSIAYASHPYVGNDCGTMPTDIETKVGGVSLSVPVVIDEFGSNCHVQTQTAPAAAKYAEVIAYAEAHSMGWAAFAWDTRSCSATSCTSYGLVNDWTTFTPNVAGRPVFEDLQAHATAGQ